MVIFDAPIQQFPDPVEELEGELTAVQDQFQVIEQIATLLPPEYFGLGPPTLPMVIHLGFLLEGRFRLREAIEVTITEEEGQIAAESKELNEFGYGNNPSEAINDLQHAIAELYFTLEEDQTRLGKDLLAVWGVLQTKIQKR